MLLKKPESANFVSLKKFILIPVNFLAYKELIRSKQLCKIWVILALGNFLTLKLYEKRT